MRGCRVGSYPQIRTFVHIVIHILICFDEATRADARSRGTTPAPTIYEGVPVLPAHNYQGGFQER